MKKLIVLTIQKKTIIVASLLFVSLVKIFLCFEHQLITDTFGDTFNSSALANKKIFIDPGHGGEDPGCNDPRLGIYEKDINLIVGQLIREILKKTEAEIIMSRENDRDYVLPKDQRGNLTKKLSDLNIRIKMAEDAKADVFVSLHVNTTKKSSYSGAEAFYNPANPYSVLLAQNIQNHLRNIPNMTKRIAKPGDYYILNNTSMPSVIVEMGYLSNSKEKELLMKKSYQENLALAISRGLVDYFENLALEAETPAASQDLATVKPKVAIIIDDLGTSYNGGVEKIFELYKYPLSLVGIGHVGPQGLNTAKALADTLPLLEEQGIELVFVSELVMGSVQKSL